MPALGTAYVSIRADRKQLKKGLAKARADVKKSVDRMQSEAARISFSMAKVSVLAFSAATVLTAKRMVELGREFERNMKTVQAWSGATGKSLKGLTDIARKMGAETEFSATQASGALKFLAAAGFSAAQSIAALPQTLDLATAGQVDLATATDITTDVLTAFGLEVSDLNRVNDAFITTTSSSNTNVTMLGMSMKMVAPTAKLFGLEVEQTAALLGTLANAGVKAEMAGSGLNMVLLKSARAAKKLGLDAGTPLVEVLRKMKEEQWDAVQIGEAFGARQVKTAAILMENVGAYEALTKKIKENKGATQKLAAIVRDSLDNDLMILSSTIQEELLKAFDFYKSDMREMAQATTKWVRTMGPEALRTIDSLKETILKIRDIHANLSNVSAITEIGLVGAILFGKKWAVALFMLSGVNDGMRTLGLNLGNLVKGGKDFAEVWQNIADVLAGRRDWQTGEILGGAISGGEDAGGFLGFGDNNGFGGGEGGARGTIGRDQTAADTAQQEAIERALEIDALGKEQALAAEFIHWEEVERIKSEAMEKGLAIAKTTAATELRIAKAAAKMQQQVGKSKLKVAESIGMAALQMAGVQGKALFAIVQAIEIAKAIAGTHAAAAMALATPPAPNFAASAAALNAGYWNVAAIAATAVAQGVASFGGGGGSASVGGGTFASPTVTTPAVDEALLADTEEAAARRGSINFFFQGGDVVGNEQFIDDIVEKINLAEDRDVFINFSQFSGELT